MQAPNEWIFVKFYVLGYFYQTLLEKIHVCLTWTKITDSLHEHLYVDCLLPWLVFITETDCFLCEICAEAQQFLYLRQIVYVRCKLRLKKQLGIEHHL